VPVYKIRYLIYPASESTHNARHKVTYDDEVAYADAKTFDRYGSIENYSSIRVCYLRESEEGSGSSLKIPSASSLEIETEAGRQARPYDNEATEDYTHA